MTIADAAKIHGLSERTLRRWIAEGRLVSMRIGNATHISPQAVEVMAEQSRRERHVRTARPKWLQLDNRAG
jgi:excisionase family DNA binding protein